MRLGEEDGTVSSGTSGFCCRGSGSRICSPPQQREFTRPISPLDKSSLRREAAYLPHVDKGSSSGLALGDFVLRLNRSELDLELIKELEGADDGPLESIPQLSHLRRQGRVRPGMVCHRVPVRRAARMPTKVVVALPPLTVSVGASAMVRS